MDIPPVDQVKELKPICNHLKQASTKKERLDVLNQLKWVQEHDSDYKRLIPFLKKNSLESELVFKSLLAIRQNFVIKSDKVDSKIVQEKLEKLNEHLCEVDRFFWDQGGIIGYHLLVLELLMEKSSHGVDTTKNNYLIPIGLNLTEQSSEANEAIQAGIMNLDCIGEIYPIGGAGDRLDLLEEKTGTHLPAACLPFLGRSLLYGLVRDVQTKEYLYYKLTGQKIVIPIAMMTSNEKDNHHRIMSICQENNWFNRSEDDFYFFMQPLVPVISESGQWALAESLSPVFKPGGHGVIWKLAEEKGVFDWFENKGCKDVIIRQINNPIAGIDSTLLAFIGQGMRLRKAFGFVICERVLGSAEGIDVLVEKPESKDYAYHITNIEYTHFGQTGIGDIPSSSDPRYSHFPANTNILFANLSSIRSAITLSPIPGMLINMKSKVQVINRNGDPEEVTGGRLESTMQNIADVLIDRFPSRISENEIHSCLRTFVVYNQRLKTISTTKQSYKSTQTEIGTPERAFYDLLANNYELFSNFCGIRLPAQETFKEYLSNGPSVLILYHPALGPLYKIIAKKIQGGSFALRSELQIDIPELKLVNLTLDGSLLLQSEDPLGIQLYQQLPRCRLENVVINNKGIDRSIDNKYWKNQITRQECVRIKLGIGSEFDASNVHFDGNYEWIVPDHYRLKITQTQLGEIKENWDHLETPTWEWKYSWDNANQVHLQEV